MKLDWQTAVARAMGAEKCSPTDKRRAFQYLYESGIGEKIGGGLADTMRELVASGEIGETHEQHD